MNQYETRMAAIAETVRTHGLHKVAANILRMDGIEPPVKWDDEGIGLSLGTKVAKDLTERRSIADGLTALAQVL